MQDYFIIASERRVYRVSDCIVAAEVFRKYFDLSHCDIYGPYKAKSLAHAVTLALESNEHWRLDSKLREIYEALA